MEKIIFFILCFATGLWWTAGSSILNRVFGIDDDDQIFLIDGLMCFLLMAGAVFCWFWAYHK